jgi:hypothetical protein
MLKKFAAVDRPLVANEASLVIRPPRVKLAARDASW